MGISNSHNGGQASVERLKRTQVGGQASRFAERAMTVKGHAVSGIPLRPKSANCSPPHGPICTHQQLGRDPPNPSITERLGRDRRRRPVSAYFQKAAGGTLVQE